MASSLFSRFSVFIVLMVLLVQSSSALSVPQEASRYMDFTFASLKAVVETVLQSLQQSIHAVIELWSPRLEPWMIDPCIRALPMVPFDNELVSAPHAKAEYPSLALCRGVSLVVDGQDNESQPLPYAVRMVEALVVEPFSLLNKSVPPQPAFVGVVDTHSMGNAKYSSPSILAELYFIVPQSALTICAVAIVALLLAFSLDTLYAAMLPSAHEEELGLSLTVMEELTRISYLLERCIPVSIRPKQPIEDMFMASDAIPEVLEPSQSEGTDATPLQDKQPERTLADFLTNWDAVKDTIQLPENCSSPVIALPSMGVMFIKPSQPLGPQMPSTSLPIVTPTSSSAPVMDERLERMTSSERALVRKIVTEEATAKKQFKIVKMQDDGNCGFYCLSFHLFKDTSHHREIRQQVSNWLEANSKYEIMEGVSLALLENGDWADFVGGMTNDKVYATTACLHAAAELFGLAINVISENNGGDLRICPKNTKASREVWMTFSDKHFNVLAEDSAREDWPDIPSDIPSHLSQCSFCTRWISRSHTSCPRCDTPRLQAL